MTRATGHIWLYDGARGATWYARMRTPAGERLNRPIGSAWQGRGRPPEGHFTRRAAEDQLRRLLTDLERGELAGVGKPSEITFKDACDEFIRHRTDEKALSASTLRDYRTTIDRFLLPLIGEETPIDRVTDDDVQSVRAELLKGRSNRTAQKHFQVLHAILERARLRKWIQTNPAADVERIPIPRASGAYRALEPEQVMALVRAAASQQDAALYVVAAFTGLRLGELRVLRWRQVRFDLESVLVDRNLPEHGDEKLPKSGRVRSVPLTPQAAVALDGLSQRGHLTEPDDYVFPNALGGPANGDMTRRAWHKAMKRAKLGNLCDPKLPRSERLTFHDMRHTFGTIAARAFPIHEVQAYLGHAQIQTTMIYVHAKPRTEDAARLGALIDGELGAVDLVPNLVPNSPDSEGTQRNSAQLKAA